MFEGYRTVIPGCMLNLHCLTYEAAVTAAIRAAKRRIWMTVYVLNANLNRAGDPVTYILHLLRQAQAAGCDVRIIIDSPRENRPNYHANKVMIRELEAWGIPVAVPPRRTTCHAKIILVDSTAAFIGSHNLAQSSLRNPLDCSAEIRDPAIIAGVAEFFKGLWRLVEMQSSAAPMAVVNGKD